MRNKGAQLDGCKISVFAGQSDIRHCTIINSLCERILSYEILVLFPTVIFALSHNFSNKSQVYLVAIMQ